MLNAVNKSEKSEKSFPNGKVNRAVEKGKEKSKILYSIEAKQKTVQF